MKEYDIMLAGEYWVADQRMMVIQEQARIDLEKYNAIPNSDYEAKLACLNSISKVKGAGNGFIPCHMGIWLSLIHI